MRAPRNSIYRQQGFTLLEICIALLLVAMLVGMIFSSARSSLALGNNIVQTQNEEMLQQAFFEFMDRSFSSLPGNARIEVVVTDTGSHYLTDLTLQNVPMNFTWGGTERTARAIQISTIKRRSGLIDLVMSYYENEILDQQPVAGEGNQAPQRATEEKPFAQIVLLKDLGFFEWQFLDATEMAYRYDWDIPSKLPLQVEMVCAFSPNSPEIRHVTWISPRVRPEQVIQNLRQRQSNR